MCFTSFAYVGCFQDSLSDRALPFYAGINLNIEECQCTCKNNGFMYAGLQWWGECWCGDSDYDKHGSSDSCDCEGDNQGSYVSCVYKPVTSVG